MKKLRHQIPLWVARGKTIKQLIKELESFENQDLEVRLSLDYGDTHSCISLVTKGFDDEGNQYCVLSNSEIYYENEWQDFMDKPD
ncbi:hypothetical protein [Aeromonas hydrophila]|uniref:hypothetical protein n=1 Tax=Aeromonas hydrophila TaxID=644 RepID=UPI001C78C378|nr:hypothetical protein [Aeromonas hydrophila]MCR3909646.1 hypothetical protein [Aeromonas hydrophila]QWL68664.1 hypothetical protein HQ397_20495 [Aeromonas hydrophila]